MKKISLVIPCYNEEKTIEKIYQVITGLFAGELKNYDYEMIFVDDYSKDSTRSLIREICNKDREHCKAVFNAANFGFSRNVFSALQQGTGDATFLFFADMQDPPELLPEFLEKWENGASVVLGRKLDSKERPLISFFRKSYYALIGKLAEKRQISDFNGFGLYDRSFIEVLKQIEDIEPFFKSVVAEYAADYETVFYHHRSSERHSSFNMYMNYDFAMEGITTSTKKIMRFATLLGVIGSVLSFLYAIYVIVRKLIDWDVYPVGMASLQVGVFFIGGIVLFFIGILGEYVMSINLRTMKKPRVVIGEKINF